MTRAGILDPMSEGERKVLAELENGERLIRGRVHPMAVLYAQMTYGGGHSLRGSSTWTPNVRIVDALDAAFYLAFGAVEPANKRTLIGLDVSSSMGQRIGDGVLSASQASAAMALVMANTEPAFETIAFTAGGDAYGQSRRSGYGFYGRGNGVEPFPLSARQRIDDVMRQMNAMTFGATDCSLPMLYALSEGREVDTFVVLTDSETWHGSIHPAQALKKYREQTGIPARLAVIGMAANGFSIADPKDAGMLDFVGFDTATPNFLSAFSRGEV
jgi:60 kDa SS-A/Ro ribonucleoprotein